MEIPCLLLHVISDLIIIKNESRLLLALEIMEQQKKEMSLF